MAAIHQEEVNVMEAIIALVVSALGAHYCNLDFCTTHTFVSVAIALYKAWIDYADDKATKG